MDRVWPVLAALLGPGVSQAMLGRRRAAAVFVGLFAASLVVTAFTIWGLLAAGAVFVGAVVDSIVYVARRRTLPGSAPIDMLVALGVVIAISFVGRLYVVEAFKIPSSAMLPTLQIDDHIFISKLARSPTRGDLIVFRHPCQPHRDYIKRVVALANDTVEIRCGVLHVNGRPVPTKLVTAEDSYQDYDEMGDQRFTRQASRYRETLGDRAYDVFHSADYPQRAAEPQHHDFPADGLRNCSTQLDPESRPSTAQQPGKLVDTGPPGACTPTRHFVVPAGHVFTLGDNRDNSNDSRYWGAVPVDHIKGRVTGIWLPLGRFGAVD